MYANFGEIGATIKDLMEEFRRKATKPGTVSFLTKKRHLIQGGK